MRIDKSCIDHNVNLLLDDVLTAPWDMADQSDDQDHFRIMSIGYIRGVLDFADKLKKVLDE